MKLLKRISSTILGMASLFGLGCASAVDYNVDLTLGQTHTFNHLHTDTYDYSGAFADTGTFELSNAGSVNVSITDNELTSVVDLLSVSAFAVYDSNSNVLFSTSDLVTTVIPLSDLAIGVYTLQFVGSADGVFGAAYDVTVSAVPLPAAAWLFGTALLGFVAFSARRTV
ncbi:MAG: VPLPA-CTERM sorting domain-containing protein [Candidatus Thiodiazotropha sp. 'RUGA']|nr:VPLPA-CTERM sorting domain-containing protein [Candidatus Thiodiazotropha sp. 'RUGA']